MNGVSDTPGIERYVDDLAASHVGIREIWLIGSRATGTNRPDSDWDLVVKGDARTLDVLRAARHLHRTDVDCLIEAGSKLIGAWGPSKTISDMVWIQSNDSEASYIGKKWSEREGSTGVVNVPGRGVRIWKREHAT